MRLANRRSGVLSRLTHIFFGSFRTAARTARLGFLPRLDVLERRELPDVLANPLAAAFGVDPFGVPLAGGAVSDQAVAPRLVSGPSALTVTTPIGLLTDPKDRASGPAPAGTAPLQAGYPIPVVDAGAGLDAFDPAFANLLTLASRPPASFTAAPTGGSGAAANGASPSGGAGASNGPVAAAPLAPAVPTAASPTSAADALFAVAGSGPAPSSEPTPSASPTATPAGASGPAASLAAAPPASPGAKPVLVGNWKAPPKGKTGALGPSNPSGLFVLNANNAQTLFQGVVYHDFSTWNADLRAQLDTVLAPDAYTFSWDTSQAPDAQGVTGANTYNLLFHWASFTGPARTDAVTLTANDGSGSLQTLTVTFLVAGTDSPAFSGPPTSFGNWHNLVGSDQVKPGAAAVTGPDFRADLERGDLVVTHELAPYDPTVTPLSLTYSSNRTAPDPYVLATYTVDPSQPVAPSGITGSLTFDGATVTLLVQAGGYMRGDLLRFKMPTKGRADSLNLSTGRYPVAATFVAAYQSGDVTTTLNGYLDLVRGAASDIAPGWSLTGLTTLYPITDPNTPGVLIDNGDGTSDFYAGSGGSFASPPGDFATLTGGGGGYTLTLPDGVRLQYNGGGQETAVVYTSGLTTTFTYAGGRLATVTGPDNQTVRFNGGTITDPAGRVTRLGTDGTGRLTTVTDPDLAVTQYGYPSSGTGPTANLLVSVTDPDSNVTAFNGGLYLTSIQRPGGALLENITTDGNNDTLAVDQPLSYSDPNGVTWVTGSDWLGFGSGQAYVDAYGYLSPVYRDANALPWLASDNLGRRTRAFFDGQANPLETVLADDTFETRLFNGFGEVTSYTDPNGHTTAYGYDAYGNLTSLTDALTHTWNWHYDSRSRLTSASDPLTDTRQWAYDVLDRMTLATDATSGTTRVAYDSAGNATSVTDPRGYTTTYTYDNVGRVKTKTTPDGSAPHPLWQYAYDSAGNLTSVTDPLLHVTTLAYDARNRLTKITDALSHVTSYALDGNDNLVGVTDGNNHPTSYGFDNNNRPVSVTDALGKATSSNLDATGQVTSVTDANQHTTNYAYSIRGFRTGMTDALSHVTSYAYDKVGNLTLLTDPLTHPTQYAYDAANRLTQTTDALSHATQYAYDAANRLTQVTDPLTHPTTTGYDRAGRVTSVTDALSHGTTTAYDLAGNATAVTDALSHTTTYGYDPLNRLTSVTDPLTHATTSAYDAAGNLTSVTDALSHTTTYAYDPANRQTLITDALQHPTTLAYDAANNLTAVTDALSHTTTYGLDADNRLTLRTDALSHTTATAYDNVGNITSVSDGLNHTTSYGYDAANRRTSTTDALTRLTTTAYDAAGNVTAVTDPDSNTTRYAYDLANRLTLQTDPLSHTTANQYDAADRLTQTTDRDGRTRTFGYDNANRQTTENWLNASGTATYTITNNYDAANRLTSASDPDSSYTWSYDNADRVTTVDNAGTPNAPHVVMNYGYDAANKKTVVNDNFGAQAGYGFDAANRLTLAQLSTGSTLRAQASFNYDNADRLTGVTRNTGGTANVTTAYNYDNADRVTGITHSSSVAGTLSTFTYAYDNADRVTQTTAPEGTGNYAYDNTDQLTSVTGWHPESYGYDNNGNRNTNGNTPGTGNRQQSDGTYNYTYDNEGNVLVQTRISDGQYTTYSWDYRNRLTEAVVKTAANVVVTDDRFVYDVNDRRIGKSVNGVWTWTAYDGANAFADFNGSGAVLEHYLYGQGMDSILARVDGSNNTAFYLTDRLGSVRQVVDVNGTVLDQLAYDSFGKIVSETNPVNGDRFKWDGREWDAELYLYYFHARYYIVSAGRFLSEDPSGLGPDINPYRYIGNGPTNATDPSGLEGDPPPFQPPRVDLARMRCAICHGDSRGWVNVAAFPSLYREAPPDQKYFLNATNWKLLDAKYRAATEATFVELPLAAVGLVACTYATAYGNPAGPVGMFACMDMGASSIYKIETGGQGEQREFLLSRIFQAEGMPKDYADASVPGFAIVGGACKPGPTPLPRNVNAPKVEVAAPQTGKTVYTVSDVPIDVNRLPQAVPADAKVIPSRAYGGTYVVEKSPLEMTPAEFNQFVRRNWPNGMEPKRLSVIEVPEGGVKVDPSVPKPEPGTGHVPPNSGAKVVAEYEITYDQWGMPTFKKIGGK